MFNFIRRFGKNKELEEIKQRLQMNVSNNYKDAAQLNLKEFEEKLQELEDAGKLSDNQKVQYHEVLTEYKAKMTKFTHKDQKVTW